MAVILDDVFAGQDAATEEHVYQNLFAETGHYRRMGIPRMPSRLAYADHVVALDVSGHIVHQGSFAQLQSDTDYLHGLAVEQNGDSNAVKASSLMQQRPETVPNGPSEQDAEQNSDDAGSPGRVLSEQASYAYYFGSLPVWHTILLAALAVVYAAGHRITGLVLSFWTQTAEESGPATNNYCLGLFAMRTGFAVVGITGTAYFFLVMVPLSSGVLHARLLQAVMDAPLAILSRTDVGVLDTRFIQDYWSWSSSQGSSCCRSLWPWLSCKPCHSASRWPA